MAPDKQTASCEDSRTVSCTGTDGSGLLIEADSDLRLVAGNESLYVITSCVTWMPPQGNATGIFSGVAIETSRVSATSCLYTES